MIFTQRIVQILIDRKHVLGREGPPPCSLFGVKAPTRWLHDDPAGEHLTTLQLVHCILSSLLLNIYGNGNEMPRFSAYRRRLQVTWVSRNGGT